MWWPLAEPIEVSLAVTAPEGVKLATVMAVVSLTGQVFGFPWGSRDGAVALCFMMILPTNTW